MIRALHYQAGGALRTGLEPQDFPQAIARSEDVLWIDMCGESPAASEPVLAQFGFHPLSIDDALQETHAPKLDDWGGYLYIVLNALQPGEPGGGWEARVEELDIFLGSNYVLTHHDTPIAAIDETWVACQRDPRATQNGADHLLYRIIDHLVAGYMPIVEYVDQAIDEIEGELFDRPTPRTLERVFALKRVLLAMRRILLPQREVLNKLARDDYLVIDPKDRIFFRDIYDHIVRLHDLNESLRDLIGGAMDTYLSVVNNRMNEVMKTLTVITTLFMPLTFIAGFFGMNFLVPRAGDAVWELMQRPAFYLVIALMGITPVLMYRWMRSRTWI